MNSSPSAIGTGGVPCELPEGADEAVEPADARLLVDGDEALALEELEHRSPGLSGRAASARDDLRQGSQTEKERDARHVREGERPERGPRSIAVGANEDLVPLVLLEDGHHVVESQESPASSPIPDGV